MERLGDEPILQRAYGFAKRAHEGHLAQNIYLISNSLTLKTCAIGGFVDNKINKIVDLDGEEEGVLYLLAVGS